MGRDYLGFWGNLWVTGIWKLCPPSWRYACLFQVLAWLKIPLLAKAKMKLEKISSHSISLRLPFIRINKNHLGTMYFGSLAMGADAAVGTLAVYQMVALQTPMKLLFSGVEMKFLKRIEQTAWIECESGDFIREMMQRAVEQGQRVTEQIQGDIKIGSGEVVGTYALGLSLKPY